MLAVIWLAVLFLGLGGARAQTASRTGAATARDGQGPGQTQPAAAARGPEQDLAALEKLAQTDPSRKGVQHALGVAFYRVGKLADARKALERAMAENPGDVEAVQLEGLTLYRLGQPAAAIPYLQRVQQFNPDVNADASQVLALCFLNTGKLEEARAALAAEYGVPATGGPAYLLLARLLLLAEMPEQSAEAAQRALTLSPQLPLAHFVLGEVSLAKSDAGHAVAEFEAERQLNPGYAPVYERLGDAYLRADKPEQAQQALMQALALDTSSTGPFILMGKVLLRRGDPETAAMYLRRAERMDAANPYVHTFLGQAYHHLGREPEAKREFEAAASVHAAQHRELPSSGAPPD